MTGSDSAPGVPPASAPNKIARGSASAIALLGWYALLLQLYVSLITARANGVPAASAVVNYFSFFTILTNLLVAMVLTCSLRAPFSNRNFAARPSVQSAAAVYIAIVGIVYSVALRSLWSPEGLQKIADIILHDAVPVLYLLYWLLFVPKGKHSLRFGNVLAWLVYPALYLAYSLIRGGLTGIYPYPFIDVSALGYARVALNGVVLLLAFLEVSVLLVAIGRWLPGKESEYRRY